MAKVVEQMEEMAQALEVEQWQIRSTWGGRMAEGLSIIRPAHGHGHVGAIGQAENQIRIDATAQADDCTPLAMEWMMGMGDRDIFYRRLGY